MTLVSETTPSPPGPTGRLSTLAREVETLARTDAAGARERLLELRALLEGLVPLPATDAAGLVRILDQLDADLRTGRVRSITGLGRRVRQLEARAAREADGARLPL
ncbi:MAG TPA: hypothetical protein VFC99_02755 [Acidimicrobiia bacterium]|nr:hypothetical protein [Acidimicrobiia bacterium]